MKKTTKKADVITNVGRAKLQEILVYYDIYLNKMRNRGLEARHSDFMDKHFEDLKSLKI